LCSAPPKKVSFFDGPSDFDLLKLRRPVPRIFGEKILPAMTDPSDSLRSFQQALIDGEVQLRPGEIDPELFVHSDQPQGKTRITYVRLQRQTVTALAIFVLTEPIEGTPCFQLGVAVPEAFHGQGRAKSVVDAAIIEMKNGLARNKIPAFYVEGIVGTHNEPSQHVAAATISTTPVAVTDKLSGLPALQYLRKIA
jgi:hypothetical protein